MTQTSVFFSFKGCRRVRNAILESSVEFSAGFDVPVLGMGAILAMLGSVSTLQRCQSEATAIWQCLNLHSGSDR